MRECGIIETRVDESMKGHAGIPFNILSCLFGDGSIKVDANLPSKKVCGIEFYFHIQSHNLFACLLYTIHYAPFFRQIRGHLRSLKPGDACKLLDKLVSAWKTRCSRLYLHVCSMVLSHASCNYVFCPVC
jgi:U3 small nucleolar RNA-associated protein 5